MASAPTARSPSRTRPATRSGRTRPPSGSLGFHWCARSAGGYAFRSLAESGATVAFGSDSPVETIDPLAGLHAAVTRQRPGGTPPGGWYPEELPSLEHALRCYFQGGAFAGHDERLVGRVAPGFAADLVVLSADIFSLEPAALARAGVDLTVVNGAVVFERAGE